MTADAFETMLASLCAALTKVTRGMETPPTAATDFEELVRAHLPRFLDPHKADIDNPEPHPHIFPDILIGAFGIEVKVTDKDSWRTVANSVFEGTRKAVTEHVYIVYGKMGGVPEVRWNRYEDCVIHVRTSHRPRFEVEIGASESLFERIGVTYAEFCAASETEKMRYIRAYARTRLQPGERLWWLEEEPEDDQHSLPLEVRLYMNLSQEEKRRCRAEAALLCPEIVKPPRSKKKYEGAAMYLLTYHGILCPQARDLFSAGSVALRSDSARGGLYIQRALGDLETEMREAAAELEDKLFVEYWGRSCPPAERIQEWLKLADKLAKDSWTPSEVLFRRGPAEGNGDDDSARGFRTS